MATVADGADERGGGVLRGSRARAASSRSRSFCPPPRNARRFARTRASGRVYGYTIAGALTRRQHALLWRLANASALDTSTASEGIRLSAMTLQQSEHRLRVAYQSFDEALRSFEARLPQDCVDRRCVTIPPGGVRGVPGFEEKSAEETMCSICITPVDTPGERLCLLDCGHAFHLSCVESWLHGNPSCPNCRRPVEADGNDDDDATPSDVARGRRSVRRRTSRGVADGVGARRGTRSSQPHSTADGTRWWARISIRRRRSAVVLRRRATLRWFNRATY